MFVDSHVHLRDFNQKHKETIRHGLEVALDSGVDAVFDMPNTDPPVTTEERVKERLTIAKNAGVSKVFYGTYIGITTDTEQLKTAIAAHRKIFPQLVGMKLYAGHSTGNMGVINKEDQEKIYEILGNEEYRGVLVVHCEKESEIFHDKWNASQPLTHCLARPEKSEIESVKDQIAYAQRYNFRGKMHIAHISSPTAVEIVNHAKNFLTISCGICPHHFIYGWNKMNDQDGIMYKMNPPLRSPESRRTIFQLLKEGKIDWIETDHAPHSLQEKINAPWASGITGLDCWPLFGEFLRMKEFSDEQICKLSFENIANRFGIDIPYTKRKTQDRMNDYPFDYYKEMRNLMNV